VAEAALRSANAQVSLATAAIDAATARAEAIDVQITESTLVAPRSGRVQYRLALPGEVLPACGKVITVLDLTDVYMTIFLPTRDAGRLRLGSEARLVFDAAPQYVVPAIVTYVASDAQFTPKFVETQSERESSCFVSN
jgi:HlyD family secretion protein